MNDKTLPVTGWSIRFLITVWVLLQAAHPPHIQDRLDSETCQFIQSRLDPRA